MLFEVENLSIDFICKTTDLSLSGRRFREYGLGHDGERTVVTARKPKSLYKRKTISERIDLGEQCTISERESRSQGVKRDLRERIAISESKMWSLRAKRDL